MLGYNKENTNCKCIHSLLLSFNLKLVYNFSCIADTIFISPKHYKLIWIGSALWILYIILITTINYDITQIYFWNFKI